MTFKSRPLLFCILIAGLLLPVCGSSAQAPPASASSTLPPSVTIPPSAEQKLRPHEPLDPTKSQSLAISPLSIVSSGKVHAFTVELAATPKQRDTGLMHRRMLLAGYGMLFDFQREQRTRFWMRNTFIPLDMLFIRKTGEIIFIAPNVQPHSEKPVGPQRDVQAVLELPGGTVAALNIKTGDVVQHAIFKK